jgi:hypothetical protein
MSFRDWDKSRKTTFRIARQSQSRFEQSTSGIRVQCYPAYTRWSHNLKRKEVFLFLYGSFYTAPNGRKFSATWIGKDMSSSGRGLFQGIIPTIRLESSIFWDTTPCSPLKVIRCFGRTCCLHLQGRKISQVRNQLFLLSTRFHAGVLLGYIKRQLTFTGLHCGISQKIEHFIATAVRTSNPT